MRPDDQRPAHGRSRPHAVTAHAHLQDGDEIWVEPSTKSSHLADLVIDPGRWTASSRRRLHLRAHRLRSWPTPSASQDDADLAFDGRPHRLGACVAASRSVASLFMASKLGTSTCSRGPAPALPPCARDGGPARLRGLRLGSHHRECRSGPPGNRIGFLAPERDFNRASARSAGKGRRRRVISRVGRGACDVR